MHGQKNIKKQTYFFTQNQQRDTSISAFDPVIIKPKKDSQVRTI